MYNYLDIGAGGLMVAIFIFVIIFSRRGSTNLNRRYFQARWNKLQKLCSDRKQWYQAIIDADALLDEALRRRGFKGKTTGERLVSAQHDLSSNDALWLSHKLKNKIEDNPLKKLNKKETVAALASFRLALKDLGALGEERKAKSRS